MDDALSYEELVALLQKSTVLQQRRGVGQFSKKDLLEAAKELGIDSALTSEVVDAHLARRGAVDLAPRPFNTRILLTADAETFDLTIPPLPLTARQLAPLGFIVVWFSFVAFWTKNALGGSGMFAAFSIPFWLVGVAMTWRFVTPLVQTTRVKLNRVKGMLRTSPLGKTRQMLTSEIRARIGDHVRYRHQGTQVEQKPSQAVLLEYGTDTFALLDGHSDQEQKWVESELRNWLLNP